MTLKLLDKKHERVTPESLKAHYREHGWPIFDDITYDHIDDDGERDKLKAAVDSVEQFMTEIQSRPGQSLILIASEVEGDEDRTGYGCGKTMLASIVHYANARRIEMPDEMYFQPLGKFYEAREIMGLFDESGFSPKQTFSEFGNLVVIDDVGREGSLRWEKRDYEMQVEEKRSRYYNIIDHCYKQKIGLILTSNLESQALASLIGGAAWSRLLETAPEHYKINLTGVRDMRPILGAQEWF